MAHKPYAALAVTDYIITPTPTDTQASELWEALRRRYSWSEAARLYWDVLADHEATYPPIDPTGDPLDDDEEDCCLFCGPQTGHDNPICPKYDPRYDEPADASYVTGWDQHGPSYE